MPDYVVLNTYDVLNYSNTQNYGTVLFIHDNIEIKALAINRVLCGLCMYNNRLQVIALSDTINSEFFRMYWSGSNGAELQLNESTGDGFYYHGGYFPDSVGAQYTTNLTIFENSTELLAVLKTAYPIVNPGVHVTFSPVYIPTYPGVHVQFNPVSLNPYEPGGESEPGGGGGDYDNPTDVINLPDLPTVKVSPFVKLWNPAEPEMQQLSDYIFSDNVWDAVSRQLFGNPIQYIISMGIVPVPLSIGGVKVPFHLGEKIGNFNMYEVGQQYMRYSCGSVTIPQYWKSFMDYEPHTKIQIFLPFIGYRDLMASEVIGKEITVTYHIDVFSGACVAFVQPNGSVLYQYNGNVLTTIPYSANEFGNIITGAIGAVGGVATGLLGISGAFAPAIGGMMAISGFTNAFSSVVGMGKESVIHGGNASSTSGLLSTRTPYVILNRPKQAIAERQNEYHGYATWYRANDFLFAQGFTKLAQIHLEGIPATDWEIQEIERLLKEGVIF